MKTEPDRPLKYRTWWAVDILLLLVLVGLLWQGYGFFFPQKKVDPRAPIVFVYLGLAEDTEPRKTAHVEPIVDHPFLGLGYDFDSALARRFAEQQGREAQFVARASMAAVNTYLLQHPEAIGLGLPQVDNPQFIGLPAYRQVSFLLVSKARTPFPQALTLPSTTTSVSPSITPSRTNAPPPRTIAYLSTSPFAENLEELLQGYLMFKLLPIKSDAVGVLIQNIQDDEADYALINRGDWNLLSNTHPNWVAQLSIDERLSLGWRVTARAPESWLKVLRDFFVTSKQNELLLSLAEQFRPDYDRLDNADLRYFAERRRTRLTPLLTAFQQAAEATQLPAALLMALSYQESQWDASQVSSTGARGLMMINAPTAEFLRLSPEPNSAEQIAAGARYLKILHDDLAAIAEPDRTLIATASYNIGPGAMSRLLTRMVSQYALYNAQSPSTSLSLPLNLNGQKQPPTGTLIRPNLSPDDWTKITWPRLRQYILEQSLLGRVSSQPVILTERVRIFQSLLENRETVSTVN